MFFLQQKKNQNNYKYIFYFFKETLINYIIKEIITLFFNKINIFINNTQIKYFFINKYYYFIDI